MGKLAPKTDFAAQFAEWKRGIERRLDALAAASPLLSAVIGKGGVTVKDGGSLTIEDGGDVLLRGGGNVDMYDANGTLVGRMYVAGLDFLDPETGGGMSLQQGQIRLWDDYNGNPDNPGRIRVDQGRGINYLRLFPPHSSGTGQENSISIRGRKAGEAGRMFFYTDGGFQFSTDGGELGLYGLPTTSGSSNLRLATIGGKWTVGYVSSSRRYKQDIAPAQIDPSEVLSLWGSTWRDNTEVDNDPDTTKRSIGFIAEELDEHPTLRQFVDYDDQGRPDAIQYDRLSVALLAVVKDQDARLADLTERLEALEARNA